MNHLLFCYGTLQVPQVIAGIIQRIPPSTSARLPGYGCRRVTKRHYPGLVALPEQCCQGRVYKSLTLAELRRLDQYEGSEYRRIRCMVEIDGKSANKVNREIAAWVYEYRFAGRLTDQAWSLETYQKQLKLGSGIFKE